MTDFSRRTVVRGATWTVPVIAIAAQAPAFAASAPPIKLTYVTGVKCPGNSTPQGKAYIFQFTADSVPAQGSIIGTSVTLNGTEIGVDHVSIVGTTIYLVTDKKGSSPNATGEVKFTYTSGMPAVTQTVTFNYNGTPPAQDLCNDPTI